jgi:hypothetical protein
MTYSLFTTRPLRPGLAVAALGILFTACGSDSTTNGGGPDGSTTGTGQYTLDNVCDVVAPRVCGLRKPCCTAAGIGFDEAGCEADFKSRCELDVAAAKSGDETFDPSGLDACFAKLPDIFAKCTLTLADLQTVPLSLRVCNAFAGKKGEGAACTRNSECAPSADANTWVSCVDKTKTCTKLTIAKQGDGCDLSKSTLCDIGLYCDAPPLSSAGTCKSATPTGQTCKQPAATDPECGIGAYCDQTSTTCTEARAAGETCTLPGECASGSCTSGKCAVGQPYVSASDCGK